MSRPFPEPADGDLPVRHEPVRGLAAPGLGGRASDHGHDPGHQHRRARAAAARRALEGEGSHEHPRFDDAPERRPRRRRPRARSRSTRRRAFPRRRPTPKQQPKVEIRRLSFFYGKFQALHDIDLDIHDRQITAFIGPSGCGKSTLLRTLNRIYELYPGQRATGQVHARRAQPARPRRRRESCCAPRSAWCFRSRRPFPMSVQDNISFGVAPLREALARRDGGARAVGAGKGRAVVRGQGQAAPGRHGAVGRAAAAPVHRARGRGQARGAAARRAGLGAGSHLDAEDRAAAIASCAGSTRSRS